MGQGLAVGALPMPNRRYSTMAGFAVKYLTILEAWGDHLQRRCAMSKRVANSKSPFKARRGRIRIGWRRKRAINSLLRQQEQLSTASITDEGIEVMKKIRRALRSVIPKKQMRRHQGR